MTGKHNRELRRTTIESLESRRLLAVSGLPIDIGAGLFDAGKRVVPTPDGGFVSAGLFSSTVDFDPGAGTVNVQARGDTDIYIVKHTSTGALQWMKRIGGDSMRNKLNRQDEIDIAANPRRVGTTFFNGVGSDSPYAAEYINDLIVNPDGTVMVVGSFIGEVDFDPSSRVKTLTTRNDDFHDAFVMKLDAAGRLDWVNQYGAQFTDIASAIARDSAGNFLVTGLFTRTVDFVKGNTNFRRTALGRADVYVMKLSPSGRMQWVNAFGGDGTGQTFREAGNDIAVDSANNVYVVGTFAGKVDFDPGPAVSRLIGEKQTDAYLTKFTPSGRYVRAVMWGGKGYDGMTNVAIDSSNNIIVAGYFEGDEFDANPGSGVLLLEARPEEPDDNDAKFTDVFVQTLDSNFAMQRTVQLEGSGTEFINQLAIDSTDAIVISGGFYGTADFQTGADRTSVRGTDDFDDRNDGDRDFSYDAFVWKITPSGAGSWVQSFGAALDDFGMGLGLASDDSILVTGRFQNTVDFDPGAGTQNRTGQGFGDAFITQFDTNGLFI